MSTVNTLNDDKTTRLYLASDIYDPDITVPPGSTDNRVIPEVGSGVWVNGNELWKVDSVDPVTGKSKLVPADSPGNDASTDGLTSHRNTILRLMVNNQITPIPARVDMSVNIWDSNVATYCLYRYPDDLSKRVVISSYTAGSNVAATGYPPVVALSGQTRRYVCSACQITQALTDNETIGLALFDVNGNELYYTVLYAKQSTVVTDPTSAAKQIVSLTVGGAQSLPDGTLYMLEGQSITSLDVYGILTYADGSTKRILVDQSQTFRYGDTDFIPAFTGMKQVMQLRYNLGPSEVLSSAPTQTNISTVFYVKVLTGQFSLPAKISVYPYFDPNSNGYILKYFLYTTKGTVYDITNNVTIVGTPFQPFNYVNTQTLVLSVDLSTIGDPDYTVSTPKLQTVTIKLNPVSSYVRWTISDTPGSLNIYGGDGPNQRRAVLYYDVTQGLYFIPKTIFQNQQSFLLSFYQSASPLYDSRVITSPVTPTNFSVRDPYTNTVLSNQSVSSYTTGFSLSQTKNYIGGTVLVEFSVQSPSGTSIVYGVPVDVYAGTYTGP